MSDIDIEIARKLKKIDAEIDLLRTIEVPIVGAGAAHNVLSATHIDSTAAAAVQGDVIRAEGTTPPLWTRYPIGTHWQLFGVNAGQDAPEWQAFDWDFHVIAAGGDGVHDHSGNPEGGVLPAAAPAVHDIIGALHSYTGGAALDVFGLSGANTLAKLTPSSAPGAASAILKSDAAGGLTLAGAFKSLYIDFPEASVPANPAVDNIRLFAVSDATFTVLETITDLGIVNRINQDTFRIARNTSGAPIAAAKAIYFTGSTGNKPNFSMAKADAEATMPAVGVTTAVVNNNNYGEIMILGRLLNVKTDYAGWLEGDQLYVDAATAGELTNVRPVHPNFAQWIGTIEVVHAVNGIILVNTQSLTGVESGTNRNSYAIGNMLAGAKALVFAADVSGTLTWTPATSNKVITLPNLTGNVALGAGTLTNATANDVTVAAHTHAVTGPFTSALTATYIGYGSGAGLLTGDANLTWNSGTRTLTLGGASGYIYADTYSVYCNDLIASNPTVHQLMLRNGVDAFCDITVAPTGIATFDAFSSYPTRSSFVFTPTVTFTAAPLFSTMSDTWLLRAGTAGIVSGSATATLTSAGVMTLAGRLNANKVGENLRIKSDGTDANDGGNYADAVGNIYFANWNADRGWKIAAAGEISSLGTGNVKVTGAFGCNGATAQTRLTVTGAKGGNTALASLLTQLVAFGFITDSTSA